MFSKWTYTYTVSTNKHCIKRADINSFQKTPPLHKTRILKSVKYGWSGMVMISAGERYFSETCKTLPWILQNYVLYGNNKLTIVGLIVCECLMTTMKLVLGYVINQPKLFFYVWKVEKLSSLKQGKRRKHFVISGRCLPFDQCDMVDKGK